MIAPWWVRAGHRVMMSAPPEQHRVAGKEAGGEVGMNLRMSDKTCQPELRNPAQPFTAVMLAELTKSPMRSRGPSAPMIRLYNGSCQSTIEST